MMTSKNASVNPERVRQVETLIGLISQPNELIPSSIFVYGHSSSGKKHIVTKILKENALKYLLFNCIESYSPKLLFESILGSYSCYSSSRETSNEQSSGGNPEPCDNMMDFIIRFTSKFSELGKDEKFFIVLAKSERIREMDNHILPAFLRLRELTKCNVCTILLSEVVWEKFNIKMGLFDPIQIFLPQYNKDEIIEILCLSSSSKYPENFYRNYLNMVLSTFYRVTRNLVTIQRLADKLFAEYCYPIETGEIKTSDVTNLWRWIVPHLKNALQFGHLHISEQQNQLSIRLSKKNDDKIPRVPALNLDLPFHSKMLLISAYLASHNSSKSDQMVFSRRKQKKKRNKKDDLSLKKTLIKGPKPFSFDRMMAIFYCINECEKLHTSLLMSQVSYLLSVHLMDIFGDDMLDEPKYICTASFEMISNVARSVDFNIVQLLHC